VSGDQDERAIEALAGLDRILEHRTRLGICILAGTSGGMTFARLRDALGETDGNLGANLKQLETAGYVDITKVSGNGRPASWYALTPKGRRALRQHLDALESIVRRCT
jgi:DNA-binding MarR family transcriptional regulator